MKTQAPPTTHLAQRAAGQDRSGTTTAAAVLAALSGVLTVAAGLVLRASPETLADAADAVPSISGIGVETLLDDTETLSLALFVLGAVWCGLAGLLRVRATAAWILLVALTSLRLLGTVTAGSALTSPGLYLDVVLLGLLLVPTTWIDCGIGGPERRMDREERHLRQVQEQIRLAEQGQGSGVAIDPYAPPPGEEPPHPRAYWDPAPGAWVRWEPAQQVWLQHDPVSRAWHPMA